MKTSMFERRSGGVARHHESQLGALPDGQVHAASPQELRQPHVATEARFRAEKDPSGNSRISLNQVPSV